MILTLPHILLILPITMKILKFIRVSSPPVYTQQIMVKTITNNQHHPPIHDEGCQNTPENAQNTEIAIAQERAKKKPFIQSPFRAWREFINGARFWNMCPCVDRKSTFRMWTTPWADLHPPGLQTTHTNTHIHAVWSQFLWDMVN